MSAATTEDLVLTARERRLLAGAIELAITGNDLLTGLATDVKRLDAVSRQELRALQARLQEPSGARELSRAQERAADAMAALHGRSRVERQADGSVVITGMLDDLDREQVCIETDGRERWRA